MKPCHQLESEHSTATSEQLLAELITLDYRGRDIKRAALDELLRRERKAVMDELLRRPWWRRILVVVLKRRT